jgi:hypothetical protein
LVAEEIGGVDVCVLGFRSSEGIGQELYCHAEPTADPSTSPVAMELRQASLRMTNTKTGNGKSWLGDGVHPTHRGVRDGWGTPSFVG